MLSIAIYSYQKEFIDEIRSIIHDFLIESKIVAKISTFENDYSLITAPYSYDIYFMDMDSKNDVLTLGKQMKSIDNNRKFILYVKQEGCPHCTAFTPTVEKVANKYKVQIYYINLTNLTKEDYELFNSEGFVNGTPTILFFENGEELGSFSRIIGNKSEKTLTNKLIARGYIIE